jgi:hypothetical protein
MKLICGVSNPIASGKFITILNTTTDLCDMFKTKKNFVKKFLIDKFENTTKVKLECPIEKNLFLVNDWILDSREIFPKSLLQISNNISFYMEFLTATKSSSKRIFIFSLKVLLEFK